MKALQLVGYPLHGQFWLRIRHIGLVLAGSLLIAAAAQISVPLKPVPANLQTLAILALGGLLGPRLGCQAVIVYLLAGIGGMPIFSNFASGIPILLGPTGGYLLGFTPAVLVFGYLVQIGWAKYAFTTGLAALISAALLFGTGYLVLSQFVGYQQAYTWGIAPFYCSELAKLLLVTLLVWRVRGRTNTPAL